MALVVRLEWSYPGSATPVDKFLIERKLGAGAWMALAGNIPPEQTVYDDATVVYGNSYSYRIIAQSMVAGNSSPNVEKTLTVTLPPPDPVPDFTLTPLMV